MSCSVAFLDGSPSIGDLRQIKVNTLRELQSHKGMMLLPSAEGATIGRGVQGRVVKKGIVMAGKYTPLENYLRNLPEGQREITLSFEQIERILNARLPPSAYEYWAWWANEKEGNHVNARAWANAGWKVESVDFKKKRAKLVRVK